MLRRHFMTKVSYKANIIITYTASQKLIVLDEAVVQKDLHSLNAPNNEFIINKLILVDHTFENNKGVLKFYTSGDKNTNTTPNDGSLWKLFSIDVSDNEENLISNIEVINSIIIEGANLVYLPIPTINKVILPINLYHIDNALLETSITKLIVPPYIYIGTDGNFDSGFTYPSTLKEIIFTSKIVPLEDKLKYDDRNITIKCPPNLIDKYKEYYPNAIVANNILYIKKVTQDSDKNINFSNDRNVDNELYIAKNYTDDGFTEINIINYDDFESNNSNVVVRNKNSYNSINYNYITEIILPESITRLTNNFIGKNITKLTIPKNVTKFDSYWSNFCILEENFINLSSATIPYKLRNQIIKNGKEENNCVIDELNRLVFVRDTINRHIIIPDYVTEFYDNPFYAADIDYVFISKNITNKTLFSYTSCIIEVSEENKKYDSRNNCNAMIETATNTLVAGNSISTIPDSVEIIERYAFYRINFKDDYILDLKNVKIIKDCAFYENNYKGILYIPKTLELFYGDSFTECYISKVSVDKENPIYNDYNDSNIVVETATNTLIFVPNYGNRNVVIPNGIKIINSYAISQWFNNDSVFIPKSVVKLKDNIFGSHAYSKDIIYEGTIEEWNNINKSSNWYLPDYIDSYTIHCSDGDIIINK